MFAISCVHVTLAETIDAVVHFSKLNSILRCVRNYIARKKKFSPAIVKLSILLRIASSPALSNSFRYSQGSPRYKQHEPDDTLLRVGIASPFCALVVAATLCCFRCLFNSDNYYFFFHPHTYLNIIYEFTVFSKPRASLTFIHAKRSSLLFFRSSSRKVKYTQQFNCAVLVFNLHWSKQAANRSVIPAKLANSQKDPKTSTQKFFLIRHILLFVCLLSCRIR